MKKGLFVVDGDRKTIYRAFRDLEIVLYPDIQAFPWCGRTAQGSAVGIAVENCFLLANRWSEGELDGQNK